MSLLSRERIAPLVYLSNNWISLTGVVIVTTATVFWLFLLPFTLRGEIEHPYIGILIFLLLPVAFILGLILIPAGMALRRRRERQHGSVPGTFPPLNWQNPDFRRLGIFVLATTVLNLIITSQFAYGAVNYMDTTSFCGTTCHRVMQPEYTAHNNSPHAHVDCVACHIGPGASWFVRSKLSGTGQVFYTLFNTYPRPIPTPVENLRPARETCEVCHWPQRFEFDRLEVIPEYADDAGNTLTKTVLVMKVGGGGGTAGIHGAHVGPNIHIRYAASDASRQTIPWVEYTDANGKSTVYSVPGTKAPEEANTRVMDCIDCHNRPSHPFQSANRALNAAIAAGNIPASLPFVKKQALAVVQQSFSSREEAAEKIPAAIDAFYRTNYASLYQQHTGQVRKAAQGVLGVYDNNIFPAMRITWGTYPDNIGHMDSPGCFRCHDGNHAAPGGQSVTQDCGACHNVIAVQEPNPKILTDLGIGSNENSLTDPR
jgi:nitrate/TMAO reductase-like tetraheme cytochrome c subunit